MGLCQGQAVLQLMTGTVHCGGSVSAIMTESHVTQANFKLSSSWNDFELLISLPSSPQFWDCRNVPPCSTGVDTQGFELSSPVLYHRAASFLLPPLLDGYNILATRITVGEAAE